ncbi:hypothetical protein KI387_030201, partial [Taxus chinensis]
EYHKEHIHWIPEWEYDWLLMILDQLNQDERDTLQGVWIWRIAWVPNVIPSNHILCDLFSYWDVEQKHFPISRCSGVHGPSPWM